MIGKLVLSDRNIFKIKSKSGNKQISARKCNILSESHEEILIKTNKEFNSKDEYVKIDPNTNTILEGFGHCGIEHDDLMIYYHLHTLNWMSNSKYNKLWDQIDTNFDLALNQTRTNYLNKVITIDPIGSIDLDDGFSFSCDLDFYYLDIHIADPVSFFDLTNPIMVKILYELQIRLQTCYIDSNSNKPTHLLPEKIVNLISLLEINPDSDIKFRRAISFCFKISKLKLDIDFELKFTKLTNIKNYTYENYDYEINLKSNFELKSNLVNLSNKLVNLMGLKLDPIVLDTDITHKMIEIFMILTNWYGGNYLINKLSWSKTILRTQNSSDFEKDFDINKIPKYTRPILSKAANYSLNESENVNVNINKNLHFTLGIQNYAHITSPMRRFVDMINHLGFYQINLETFGTDLNSLYNTEYINTKIKNYKKLSNGYDLLKFIKHDRIDNNNNKFRACLFDWNFITNTNKIICLLILYQEQYNFIKVISVELPQIDLTFKENLKKYMEFDVELYYNSNNFKSNKFPFSIKII